MEKSAYSQTNPEEVENPGSEINSYIKQFMTLRKSIEKSNKEIQYWRNQKSKLLESNCNIKTNFDKLSQQVSDIEENILENTKIHVSKKQELRDLQSARTNMSHKQWNDCLSGIESYANDFSQWITNYSGHVLMKEIESHDKECRKVGEELAILKRELEAMIEECDLNYIEANVDDNDLSINIISDVKSNNNNLVKKIRLEKDTLNKIQNKIKQSKIVILNKSKTKEKTNVF
ncbi:uncharacterized protein [Temnothorax longispinosus]|uniref:uncharacterized protein n=1 Tax=Temnothorax longispinosus TaxID=300112 RepID=UPI003A9A2FA5